jgi:hypothetical protein
MDFSNVKPSKGIEDRTGEGPNSINNLLGALQAALGWYAGGKKVDPGQGFNSEKTRSNPGAEFPTLTPRELQEEILSQDPEYRKQKAAKTAKDGAFYRKLESELGIKPRR